jgi:hypothetical protein
MSSKNIKNNPGMPDLNRGEDYIFKNGSREEKITDTSFIRLQQQLAFKTYYLKEHVLTPVMDRLLKSGSKNELVRLYRAYCYFFDRELTVKEFSAFLAHVIIDGFIRARIFYSSIAANKETCFSRIGVVTFAKFIGMTDRRLALFKYLSTGPGAGDDRLPGDLKKCLDDICGFLANFDFKQMGFDSKNPMIITGEMLQWEGYFFMPYYDTPGDREIVKELLIKEGIFSGNTGS